MKVSWGVAEALTLRAWRAWHLASAAPLATARAATMLDASQVSAGEVFRRVLHEAGFK